VEANNNRFCDYLANANFLVFSARINSPRLDMVYLVDSEMGQSSPDLVGLAFGSWVFFCLLIFWWGKFFPSTEALLSQIIYGIVSASIWFIASLVRVLLSNSLESIWSVLIWQWFYHIIFWMMLVCLNKLVRRYVF